MLKLEPAAIAAGNACHPSPTSASKKIMSRPLYACLVHYPIRDKHDHVIATAITNLDIHDIARSARTFGLSGYYVITPVKAQRWLARRILTHWNEGWGAEYNPNRKDALSIVEVCPDLGSVNDTLERIHGAPPLWVATSARRYPNTISFAALQQLLAEDCSQPVGLLFGTGWGLHPELIMESDHILEPIQGLGTYNHLSVRAAAAIIFDRLRRSS
jgi:hypothetical protein